MKKLKRLMMLATAGSLVGCTEFGGGASVIPEVTYVTSGDEGEDAGSEDAAADSASMGEPGSFTGKVILTGSQDPLPPLISKGAAVKDPEVCAAVDVPDDRLVLGEGNGVANVFIYLQKAPKGGKPLEVPADPFLFDQKNCRFLPHAVVLPVGQTVKVLSDDSIAHNTHTYPNKNQAVNSTVEPGDRVGKLEMVYRKSEAQPVSVKCDYHTWMTAYHLPVDHPYAAVTKEDGSFTISDLPPGTHSFIVWHEAVAGNFVERKLTVEIQSGMTTEKTIEFSSDKLKL